MPWLSEIELEILRDVRTTLPEIRRLLTEAANLENQFKDANTKLDRILEILAPPPAVAFNVTVTNN